jgi:hypothetical protein
MPTRKKAKKKKIEGKGRTNDASKWLRSREGPHCKYVARYSKRYCVDECTARDELITLGYYDELLREDLESEGKKWSILSIHLLGILLLLKKVLKNMNSLFSIVPVLTNGSNRPPRRCSFCAFPLRSHKTINTVPAA